MADLHRRALPHGLFPRLGHRFMRAYYHSFVDATESTGFVAELAGERVGFVVGTTACSHLRILGPHAVPLVLLGMAALVSRPLVTWWFVRTRGRHYVRRLPRLFRAQSGSGAHPAGRGSEAVLAHVAVVPHGRHLGVGAALVDAFSDSARSAGASRVRLVTRSRSGAGHFYERIGWEKVGVVEGFEGVRFERFVLDLT